MVKRLIGSDTTGSDGSVSIPYVGTGAGLVNLSVETEIDGSIVSGTYSIIDAHWYDDGVTDPKSVTWSNYFGTATVSSDGTLLERTTSSAGHYYAKNYNKVNIGAFAVEFDLVEYTDSTIEQFRLIATNNHDFGFKTMGCPQNCHVKIMVTGEKIQYQIDNGEVVDWITTSDTEFYLGFRSNGVGFIKYKNFVVYPI